MSTATETQQPEAAWVEMHELCERWGASFGTSRGWWLNRALAIYLGKPAMVATRWVAHCDCGEVDETDAPLCCSFHQGGLGTFVECDDEQCAHPRYENGLVKPWDLRPFIAQAESWERQPVEIGRLFVDSIGNAHVPVLRDGVELFAVNPQFLEVAQRFGFPTDWQAAETAQGWCLLGYQGDNLVVLLMAQAKTRTPPIGGAG